MSSPPILVPSSPTPVASAAGRTTSSDRRPVGGPRWWALGLFLGALALRLVLWARAYGFEQGDPVEYVNIAYKIAFGIGIPWWDLRPLLLSLIYVPVLFLAQLWPDPTGEAMIRSLRLLHVAFGVGLVWAVYLLGRHLGGAFVGWFAALLVSVNPIVNRLSVSTFAEVPSACFVVLALWLLTARPLRRSPLLAGLALGSACMIRYQAIAFVAPIAVWAIIAEARLGRVGTTAWRRALSDPDSRVFGLAVGLGLAVLAQAAIEVGGYGRPFHSLLVSFDYNVSSGLAPREFGQEPFEWYLAQLPDWFGLLPAVLALVAAPSLWSGPRSSEWRLVGLAAATMFVVLSALPHKELRFMAQVAPLLALFTAQGLAHVARVRATSDGATIPDRASPYRMFFQAAAGVLVVLSAAPLLWASLHLDLASNEAYADGPKRAAELRPGGTLGTIPWFVARPYTGTRLELVRMDRKVWDNREYVARTVEQSDFLLIPEYWLSEDRWVDGLVDARYRTIESYPNGVVLLQNRRLDEPSRRRPPR